MILLLHIELTEFLNYSRVRNSSFSLRKLIGSFFAYDFGYHSIYILAIVSFAAIHGSRYSSQISTEGIRCKHIHVVSILVSEWTTTLANLFCFFFASFPIFIASPLVRLEASSRYDSTISETSDFSVDLDNAVLLTMTVPSIYHLLLTYARVCYNISVLERLHGQTNDDTN